MTCRARQYGAALVLALMMAGGAAAQGDPPRRGVSGAAREGAAAVMAADLAETPTTGLVVQACGDAHVANFGKFATPVFELRLKAAAKGCVAFGSAKIVDDRRRDSLDGGAFQNIGGRLRNFEGAFAK